jgi:hypothetical protein
MSLQLKTLKREINNFQKINVEATALGHPCRYKRKQLLIGLTKDRWKERRAYKMESPSQISLIKKSHK